MRITVVAIEADVQDRGDSPSNDHKGTFRCMNRRQSAHHSAVDKPGELHWRTCGEQVIEYNWDSNPGSSDPGPNIQTPWLSITRNEG
jgi:hypothetical protein